MIQELTRTMLQDLERWNTKPGRKPLLLRGARQTGKTWIVNAFGASHFEHVARIDFMRDADARVLFDGNLTAKQFRACMQELGVSGAIRSGVGSPP
ncbi:AAA family ATPase [Bifidobacterium castoris]|uniref:AAA family ATPase n=1 Tax=Bifidobacterium castoris TaxID=2306972 RepID=UPI000F7F5CDA|nr:AAA family ATPase [Bifidobacterium castoris]